MSSSRKWMAWFLAACLVIAVSGRGRAEVQTTSTGRSKIAPDLLAVMRTGPGNSRRKLIVQFNRPPGLQIDLLLKGLGGLVTRPLNQLGLLVVDLPLSAVEGVVARPEVRYISPDRPTKSFGHLESTTGAAAIRVQSTELLGLLPTTTVYDGQGIGIAILDSGIDVNHKSFEGQLGLSRVIVNRDFTGENRTADAYGHGTHVASIAAGNSEVSDGAYTGIAPGAKLLNLRVLDAQGLGTTSGVLAAFDWINANRGLYNIRVVNLSLGTPAIDSYTDDPLCRAVRQLSNAGVVVVAAAGNNGRRADGTKIYGQIHSPGNEPSAITVGAVNTFGTDGRLDDVITTFSSRGPTRSFFVDEAGIRHYDNLLKPDMVAPGNRIVAAAAPDNSLLRDHPELDANVSSMSSRRMMYLSGSSMAAPVVAGCVALLLQGNRNLNSSLVKAILMYTAQPIAGANTLEQGAGEINIEGAIRLARIVRTDLSPYTQLGADLLTAPAPVPETSVSGQTFTWAGGILTAHSYLTGNELITKYQKIYGAGFVLNDGVIELSSSQSIDLTRMTGAISLGAHILTSHGTSLREGTVFLDSIFLLGDGVMLSDGIMVNDGIVVGDGIMVGDVTFDAVKGDETACMW